MKILKALTITVLLIIAVLLLGLLMAAFPIVGYVFLAVLGFLFIFIAVYVTLYGLY